MGKGWAQRRMDAVDVIVPCYGYGRFLRECVESVLTQSLREVRVLVIDDASPDETAAVADQLRREDSRVAYLRHSENRGHIATYNEGIALARARYLLLLSADDFLLPGALARAVALMDAHPEIGFTFGRCIPLYPDAPRPRGGNDGGGRGWRILSSAEFIELNGAQNNVATATAVVRTALQHRVGGYRADLPHAGDMEMWLRLALRGHVGLIEADQAVYRRHQQNMSLGFNGRLRDLQQRKAALDSVFDADAEGRPDVAPLRDRLIQALARDAVSQASEAFNRGEAAECERLLEFALQIFPGATRFEQWRRVAWKRRLGRKLWAAMHPMVLELRRLGMTH